MSQISSKNDILMAAILSEAAYNEDQNIPTPGVTDRLGSQLGNAVLIAEDYDPTTIFGATAWSYGGHVEIAYRGTLTDYFLREAYYGYGVGAGSDDGPQAQEAIAFYRDFGSGASTIVTGHSLGGGLAGFVGAIYGLQGVLFDHMTFRAAAANAYEDSIGHSIYGVLNGGRLAASIYGDQAPYPNDSSGLSGYHTSGELLTGLRFTAGDKLSQSVGEDIKGSASPVQLHSQALLVSLLWAQDNDHTVWQHSGQVLFDGIFGSDAAKVASALGDPLADSVLQQISYSALAQISPDGVLPFGSTALSSLFTDADTLGSISDDGGFSSSLAPVPLSYDDYGNTSQSAPSPIDALMEIAVQFAGDQALAKTTDPKFKTGVFDLDNGDLSVDLNSDDWKTTYQTGNDQIAGVSDLVQGLLYNTLNIDETTKVGGVYADTAINNFVKQENVSDIEIATTHEATIDASLAPLSYNSLTANTILDGLSSSGTITAGNGDNLVFGGSHVTVGNGNNIIVGEAGGETITVGGGNNVVIAAGGGNTINVETQGRSNEAQTAGINFIYAGTGNDVVNFDTSDGTASFLILPVTNFSVNALLDLDRSALTAAVRSYVDAVDPSAYEQYPFDSFFDSNLTVIFAPVLNAGAVSPLVDYYQGSSQLATSLGTLEINGSPITTLISNTDDFQPRPAGYNGGDGTIPYYFGNAVNPFVPGWIDTISNGALYTEYFATRAPQVLSLDQYLTKPVSGAATPHLRNLEDRSDLLSRFAEVETDAAAPSSAVSVARFLDDQDALDSGFGGIRIADTAENVAASLDALSSDGYVKSIVLTDGDDAVLRLSASQALNDTAALSLIKGHYQVEVDDSAADVSASIDALNQDPQVGSIDLIDAGRPVLTLSAEQALHDTVALGLISKPFAIEISDTAADVARNFAALEAEGDLTISLTDAGAPILDLSVDQAVHGTALIDEIANADLGLDVSGTAASVMANAAQLSANAIIVGLTVDDTVDDVLSSIDWIRGDEQISAIAIVDTAESVLDHESDLSGIALLTSVTVVDTANEVLSNAGALAADGQVGAVIAEDTASNILANASALAADAQVVGQIVSDTAVNVAASLDAIEDDQGIDAVSLTDGATPTLVVTADQAIRDASAIAKLTNADVDISVSDTAAQVAVYLDDLDSDASVSSIFLTDGGVPTLVVTASQATEDWTALSKIANTDFAVSVDDTSANVVADLDALAADPVVGSIALSDSGTPTLTVTATEAVNDARAFALISGSDYAIAVVDRAARVSAAFDQLNSDAHVSAITLTDVETPTLDLTAAQALNDVDALAKITNAQFAVAVVDTVADVAADATSLMQDAQIASITIVDTVADVLSDGNVLSDLASTTSADVVDTAANISSGFDGLNGDSEVSSISLSDGAPLALNAYQVAYDKNALVEIGNADFSILVSDTASDVAATIDALASVQQIASITLTDGGTPTLELTSSQVVNDGAALDRIAGTYAIAVVDSAFDVSAHIDELDGNPNVGSISLTDYGNPTLDLTVAQTLDDVNALDAIVGPYTVAVTGSAADVVANEAQLQADAYIGSLTIVDDVSGVLDNAAALDGDAQVTSISVTDTVANVTGAVAALSAVPKLSSVDVLDTSSNVALGLAILEDTPNIASVTFTDAETPTLSLSASQVLDDHAVLMAIRSPFILSIVDTASNISENLTALENNYYIPSAISRSITLTDQSTPDLRLSASLASISPYLKITNLDYNISVYDNVSNILTYDSYSRLNYLPHVDSVNVVDTASNVLQAEWQIAYLTTVNSVSVSDTAADVAANLDALNAYEGLDAITLTDTGTPTLTLSATQAIGDVTALSEISNAAYTIAIVDTVGNVLANAAALSADAAVSTIQVVDTAANVLANADSLSGDVSITGVQVVDTAANVLADASALSNDPFVTSVEVMDTAADVSADIDALDGDPEVDSVVFTDPGAPSIVLTVAQTLADTRILSKLGNAIVTVTDTAANILENEAALLADPAVGHLRVADTVANVTTNVDALDQVGGVLSVVVSDTAASILGATAALASVAGLSGVEVVDTSSDVVGSLAALDADPQVTSIELTDSADPLVVTAVQAAQSNALAEISNASYTLAVTDTASEVSAHFDEIANRYGYAANPAISIDLTDAGTPVLALSAADVAYHGSTLAKIVNVDYDVDVTDTAAAVIGEGGGDGFASNPLVTSVHVVDNAANVEQFFDALDADTKLASITLTDQGTPTLTLSAAQGTGDGNALAAISGPGYRLQIEDNAANVLAAIDELDGDPHIAAIGVTDTASDVIADQAALSSQPSIGTIDVLDSIYDVATNFDALASDAGISSITLSDSPNTPFARYYQPNTLNVTASQIANDADAISEITNSRYEVNASDATLDLGRNNSVTAIGTGNTYEFAAGDGADEIGAGGGSNTGAVSLGSQASPENLWFAQVGNNLQVDLMGTNDALTVDNWFSQGGYSWFGPVNGTAVQRFSTSDGSTLDAQVGQLVSAMAAYVSANPGFDPTVAASAPADSNLQGAIAAAWHK